MFLLSITDSFQLNWISYCLLQNDEIWVCLHHNLIWFDDFHSLYAIQTLHTAIVGFLNSKSQTEGVKFILDICNPKSQGRAKALEDSFYNFVRVEAKKYNLLH